jgi:pectate lyase
MKHIIILSLTAFLTISVSAQNKINIALSSGKVDSYNTSDVNSIDFGNGDTLSLSTTSSTIKYDNTATRISFIKNETGHVNILNVMGWQESAYITWSIFDGAKSYNVYIKSSSDNDYMKLDSELVRNYGSYGRADAIGLATGSYSFKIVPVNDTKTEMTANASISTSINVDSYDRQGYAHFNYTGVGAYNDNGKLKTDAKVIYVTKNNCNTITQDVITSSKGTITKGIGIGNILYLKQKGYDQTPWSVRIIGCITSNDIHADQLLSDEKGLQLKANIPSDVMNVTLEGVGNDATFNGFGITFYNGTSIEMRNLAIMNHNDDAIQIKSSLHTWIHNCDIFYGVPGSDADQVKGDGTIDVKDDSQYDTFSYNHFFDCGKCSLCGMKSETGPNYLCYHHNWFDHSDSRHPRVRTMTVHVWNNYFDGCDKYGIGATTGSSVFVENNYFRNTNKPLLISLQGTDIKYGTGTFSDETGGMIKSYGNIFAEKSSNFSYITQTSSATNFDAYEAATRDEQVPETYKTVSGNNTYNNFDTDATKIYTYTPDAATDIPTKVTGFEGAGRMNHGDIKWNFTNSTDDASSNINTGLKTLLTSYQTSFIGIFGSSISNISDTIKTDSTKTDTTTIDSTTIKDVTTCNFTNSSPSNKAFTVIGNYSNSKGSVTIDGITYSICLKMETSTSIKFKVSTKMTLTLYFGSLEDGSIKINNTDFISLGNTYTTTIERGEYTLTKKNSCNLYYIKLTPVE